MVEFIIGVVVGVVVGVNAWGFVRNLPYVKPAVDFFTGLFR